MYLLKANNLIRRAREMGVVLFVECGIVYGYPGNKLTEQIRQEIRDSHVHIRELLILSAI
jgi:hypothetical protein